MKRIQEFDTIYLSPDARHRRKKKRNIIISIFLLLCISAVVGACLGFFLNKDNVRFSLKDGEDAHPITVVCPEIPNEKKFDCYPDAPVTENQCLSRGCCYSIPKNGTSYSSLPPLNVPYCYYPPNYVGYVVKDVVQTSRRIQAKLSRVERSGFPKDVSNLNLLISFIDDSILRMKITDANSERYEVPIPLQYQTKKLVNPQFNITIDSKSGQVKITRKKTGAIIFNTDLSRLVYADQLLQLSSDLPSSYIYGIGEHYGRILRSVNWTRFTLINSDLSPIPNHALYGSHPFYMALEKGGNAHGVFLFNSNIMDVILQPTPAITFRPIGGILDFYFMLGPSPKDVTQQYSNIIGKTFMPPYWSLGFHLCRYGYNSLNKTEETMQRTLNAKIPLDVQWNDIDYMDEYKDFTYDKKKFAGLPEFVDNLHANGMHYVMITDPGLSNSEKVYPPYDEGLDDDVFVKNANGTIFIGKVWTSGTTVYPDFSHPAVIPFWTRQFERLHNDVKFDGAWIDMNEPSNFYNGGVDGCPNSSYETPQYVPGGNLLVTKTICMTAKHYYSTHYNEHNLYAYREAVATYEALKSIRRKRPFIISRASFAGQGVYSGHWSGDVFSTWEDMRYSIPSMINFNMYAMPMIGSDICGFNGNTTVELCARWQALGAFYPFSRNHNDKNAIEQDPVALGPIVVQATSISLQKRYTLLSNLYTLFYRSHAFGDTVIRPLFFEFPEDENTYSIDEQFLWGSSLMIVPVLYPNSSTVSAYFPEGLWYDALDGEQRNSTGEFTSLTIPLGDIYLSVRGGSILTAQSPALNTKAMRKNPFTLAVALDETQRASGELYWDDGDSLETYENGFYDLIRFYAVNDVLNSTVVNKGYQADLYLQTVNIAGLNKILSQVTFNGKKCVPDSSDVFDNSTSTEERVKLENFGIFGVQALSNKTLEDDVDCKFFKLGYMFVIQTKPVSLLSPLLVSWK